METPVNLRGLHEIIDRYDVFLLDQFGVLHDGLRPLPGAVHALNTLNKMNKKCVILSNSSARSALAAKKYKALGLPEVYSGFITSGEMAWNYMNERFRGKKCVWFTWDQQG